MTVLKCLKLDDNHDLALESNRIVFLTDHAALKQQVLITLKTQMGEWLFNTDFGVDYHGKFFVKNPDFGHLAAHLRASAKSVDGIESVGALEMALDHQTRHLTVNIELAPIGALQIEV